MARATRQVLKAAQVMGAKEPATAELYLIPQHGIIGAMVGVRVMTFRNRLVSNVANPDTPEQREQMTARFSQLTGLFFPHAFPVGA